MTTSSMIEAVCNQRFTSIIHVMPLTQKGKSILNVNLKNIDAFVRTLCQVAKIVGRNYYLDFFSGGRGLRATYFNYSTTPDCLTR